MEDGVGEEQGETLSFSSKDKVRAIVDAPIPQCTIAAFLFGNGYILWEISAPVIQLRIQDYGKGGTFIATSYFNG